MADYQLPSSFVGGMQGASNALSAGKLPQGVQSPILKQILPTPKPVPVDPNKSPEVFKKRFIEKHGDGVAEDGRNYSQIPAPEIVAKVIRKYGDGNTTDGIPYREFLPRPASPNDSLEYRLKQIESLSQAPKSQFYTTGGVRGQTEQEKKFTTAVTKRENEGEIVKTLKAPYRGLESVGQNLAYGTFGAGADVVDMFGGDKLADKMRKSVEKEKFQSGMLSQNKGLIGGMQSGDLSSVIETLSSGAGYLATGAKIPLYLTALSQGGNLSQEGEEQGQNSLGDKAIAYTTGGISAAIERMSGQKVIGGMMRAGIKKETATTFVQKMNNYLKGLKPSDFEAGTEVIQQGIENIGRSTMGVDYDKGIQQYFEAGLLGKILGKVGDKGFSESPVTVLPPAPPAPSRVDTKNIETLQTIKIGKRANANVERNKSRGFDSYSDIATHQEIVPTVDKTGLVKTTEQVQNLEDTLDPINDALTQSIKDEGVLIPLDEFLIDSMNEAKQYENEGASYDRYVNQIRKDFEVYKRFTDAQGRIDLSKINEIKKAKYGISNFSDVESDKANKMVGKAAKELVEKYTKGESTKAINRELARWYSARDLLLAMDGKTVKGGRLGKMAARVGGNIIGSYFGPLGSFAGGEISAAVQGQMMKGSLKTPKGNIDSGDILSKIPKRTTPQLPPASQSSADKKVVLPMQSRPVSESVLPSQKLTVLSKKESSGKKVNNSIIQKLKEKKNNIVEGLKKAKESKVDDWTKKDFTQGTTSKTTDKYGNTIIQDSKANRSIEVGGNKYNEVDLPETSQPFYTKDGKMYDYVDGKMKPKETPKVEGKTATEVLKDWKPTKGRYSMDNIDIKNTNAFPRSQYHRPEYINSDSYKHWLEQAKQGKEIPPIVVERKGDGFHILDGYHRIAAAEDAGAKKIKALVLDTPIDKTGKPFTKFTAEELNNLTKPKQSIPLSQKSEVKYSEALEEQLRKDAIYTTRHSTNKGDNRLDLRLDTNMKDTVARIEKATGLKNGEGFVIEGMKPKNGIYNYVVDFTKDTGKKFSPEGAIKKYTNSSTEINKRLREGKVDGQIDALDEFLAQAKSEKGTVYRGMTIKDSEYDNFIQKIKNEGLTDKAYISSSRNLGDATTYARTSKTDGTKGVMLEIESKNGKVIDPKYNAYNEEEILFPRGSKFEYVGEYTDKQHGNIIKLKEVNTKSSLPLSQKSEVKYSEADEIGKYRDIPKGADNVPEYAQGLRAGGREYTIDGEKVYMNGGFENGGRDYIVQSFGVENKGKGVGTKAIKSILDKVFQNKGSTGYTQEFTVYAITPGAKGFWRKIADKFGGEMDDSSIPVLKISRGNYLKSNK